jgi:small subunit ribosomal protein S8e
MGITRDSRHKHRLTGGRVNVHVKKRKFEMGRPSAMTRLGAKRVRVVRGRGGNLKFRALRVDNGNFSWGSENCTRKVRVMDVVYNATNNEYVRTKTLFKGTIVQVDAAPFKQFYAKHYGVALGRKAAKKDADAEEEEKKSGHVVAKQKARAADQKLDPSIEDQFNSGRLLACIASRPGQSGRCDGYILEGEELNFYKKKLDKKKEH